MATEQEQLLWAMLESTRDQQDVDPALAEAIKRSRASEVSDTLKRSTKTALLEVATRISENEQIEDVLARSRDTALVESMKRASFDLEVINRSLQTDKQDQSLREQLKEREEQDVQTALRFSLGTDSTGLDQKRKKENLTVAQSQGSSAQFEISIVPGTTASSSSQSSSSSTASNVSGSNLELGQVVQEARARRLQLLNNSK